MKQFSLKEFKKNPNRAIITRSGKPARIVCIDKKGFKEVVALVDCGNNNEVLIACDRCGREAINTNSPLDLFFQPVKKEGWINIFAGDFFSEDLPITGNLVYPTEGAAKQAAESARQMGEHPIATVKVTWEE